MPHWPFCGLHAGERLSVCFAWCLLLPEPITLHSFISLPQGPQDAFAPKAVRPAPPPLIGCTQLACLLSLPPRILQLGLMFQRPEVQQGAPHLVATLGHDEVAAEQLNAVD